MANPRRARTLPMAVAKRRLAQEEISWRSFIKRCYPRLQERAYFLPHVIFNRVQHEQQQLCSHLELDVAQPPVHVRPKGSAFVVSDSDATDDKVQQHVLHCLKELSTRRAEVMFVVSRLDFGNYLKDRPSWAPTFKQWQKCVPMPVHSDGSRLNGDFDVLVIHRQFGVLVAEIKAVGFRAEADSWDDQRFQAELLKKLWSMLKLDQRTRNASAAGKAGTAGQLEKVRNVPHQLMRDKANHARVSAALILPYVSRQLLASVLNANRDIKEALCQDLGLASTADPTERCLCRDQMSSLAEPWRFPDTVFAELEQWWAHCLTSHGPDAAMTDDLYEDLIARFAGPATQVEVYCPGEPRLKIMDMRTEGQAISEVGKHFCKMALFPDQAELLHSSPDRVLLTGPPGTGKTVLLILTALKWLRRCPTTHVYVVSSWWRSLAVSCLILHQIEMTMIKPPASAGSTSAAAAPPTTRWHLLDLEDMPDCSEEKVLDVLVEKGRLHAGELYIIADEAKLTKPVEQRNTGGNSSGNFNLASLFSRLCSHPELRARVWTACVQPEVVPACLAEHPLSHPLRCPPVVVGRIQEEIEQCSLDLMKTYKYKYSEIPLPSDGPQIIRIECQQDGFPPPPKPCEECGGKLAHLLLTDFSIGQWSWQPGLQSFEELRFRDVLILVNEEHGEGPPKGRNGRGISVSRMESSGFVSGLKKEKIPVRVVHNGDKAAVQSLATMTGADEVVITNVANIQGLERKIVVVHRVTSPLQTIRSMSRTTAQVVTVDCASLRFREVSRC